MSDPGPSVTNADEAKLISLIRQASRRLLFLAPGLSEPIAATIEQAWKRLGPQAVTVILDVDPEVCRLGYGTIEGLKRVQQAAAQFQTLICHQRGVRIGLLVSDDITLIFSPTPLLVEAGSNRTDQPNAIQISVLPKEIAGDVGLGPDADRKVGLDPVQSERIEAVAANVAANPPIKFDLARKVRVFNSRFQFVDLKLTGCFLSQKQVPIPSYLMGLAPDKETRQRLHASFDLVGKNDLSVKVTEKKILSEASLRRMKDDIIKRFLTNLTGYGSVILRTRKEEFEAAVKELKDDVAAFQDGVKAQLQKHITANRDAVVVALLPGIRENPPDQLTKLHGLCPPEPVLKQLLSDEIAAAFGSAEDVIGEMKVSCVFKDVAYESLVDATFIKVTRRVMHDVNLLHEEFDAASPTDLLPKTQ